MESICFKDFCPWNRWDHCFEAKHGLILDTDGTTQRRYWFQENNILRFKCFLLVLWAPLNHLAKTGERAL